MNAAKSNLPPGVIRKKRVLIVDDEQDLTWSIVRRLSKDRKSLEFLCTGSGDEALDLLRRNQVDLLVTDVRMPGMSGQELIRRVRSSLPELKIILITAFHSPELMEFGRDFQVTATLEKPFDMNDLRNLIYINCLGENRIDEGRFDHGQS
jgi:two-component system, response regulator, stage 0 sporulation protein F